MQPAESQSKNSLPLSREERLDQWCDEFERQWKAGQRPRLEDFLARANEDDREDLLRELIAVEMELRHNGNQQYDPQGYRQRFPKQLSAVEAAIVLFDQRRSASCDMSTAEQLVPDDDTHASTQAPPVSAESGQIPEMIGRYAVQRQLGKGGFAVVYLAHDTQLNRDVALKVPRLDRFRGDDDLDRFLKEARSAAQLDHPGIVRVYDVQQQPDSVFFVQQYVAGQDLAKYIKSQPPTPKRIAELMIGIAEAVGFAHQKGFAHRDLKPANILLDAEGHPHVADFGLAVHTSVQHQHRGERAGTYPYMSPEQVRGEAHRLDGRSDIWSLGVILYELLTGSRPFGGENLLDEIEHRDPRPPRQLNPTVPTELARICLVCLAKRASDRYQAAADLIDDLRYWLDQKPHASRETSDNRPPTSSATDILEPPVKIIPKGLRSYDAGDADFFLKLLPGPYDRDGLPKNVRFWKSRIERIDPDDTFKVGLMYGPSGCGKSSLLKAGLFPNLADHVLPVYVEATAVDTEVRLLKSLQKQCSGLTADASLPEMFAQLRTDGGPSCRKVLVVLDQFEQWLHAHEATADSQLLRALRQCDSAHVQCLLMVRDDFWMSATRFMQALEIPLVEDHNSAPVDLFDVDHARKVLAAFGRAYDKLVEPAELTQSQLRFLDHAVAGLSEEGRVISVRLAVFAEMMKGRPWTEESLRSVGGTAGVGVTFLDETFSAKTAPPSHRLHAKAIRGVLKALLPEQGSDIKGQMQSYDQLLAASGYADRRIDFDAVLRILDSELRLITPTEPDETGDGSTSIATSAALALDSRPSTNSFYQLTHDYLVPSLQNWLTQKQRESRQGRAQLCLKDRSDIWIRKPEKRHLPTWWEFIKIRCLTGKKSWSESERKMMWKADLYFGPRLLALALFTIFPFCPGLLPVQQYVYFDGSLHPKEEVHVFAKEAGQISEIMVLQGTHVEVGDLLVELSNPELGPRKLDLERLEWELKEKINVSHAKHKQELENRLGSVKQEIDRVEKQISRLRITSPMSGEVTLTQSTTNERVERGDDLMTISLLDGEWVVKGLIEPDEIEYVRMRQSAVMILKADPSIEFEGRICEMIGRQDNKYLAVIDDIDESQLAYLRPKAEVSAKISVGTRTIGQIFVRELFRFFGQWFW